MTRVELVPGELSACRAAAVGRGSGLLVLGRAAPGSRAGCACSFKLSVGGCNEAESSSPGGDGLASTRSSTTKVFGDGDVDVDLEPDSRPALKRCREHSVAAAPWARRRPGRPARPGRPRPGRHLRRTTPPIAGPGRRAARGNRSSARPLDTCRWAEPLDDGRGALREGIGPGVDEQQAGAHLGRVRPSDPRPRRPRCRRRGTPPDREGCRRRRPPCASATPGASGPFSRCRRGRS